MAPRVFLSAGEVSGDAHAAAVAHALRAAAPGIELAGIGGSGMADAGVRLVHHLADLQAVGVVEAVGSLPAHLRALRTATRTLRAGPWHLAITVDYPGFHRVLARQVVSLDIPLVHYIAPQFWAWGTWRMRGFRRVVRHALVILPFEEPFFRAHGVPATFVGHPLRDRRVPSRAAAKTQLGLAQDRPVLGLFPGSRPSERAALWPAFREAARLITTADPSVQVLVAGAGDATFVGAEALGGRLVQPASLVAAASDAAIAKSGTTTLELALAGTPHVLAYRVHPLTYALARRAVTVPWIGLVNLIAEREVVPECVQSAATPSALARVAGTLLDRHGTAASDQRAAFRDVAERLGPPGASARAAALALDLAA